jgi:hypothetical protein
LKFRNSYVGFKDNPASKSWARRHYMIECPTKEGVKELAHNDLRILTLEDLKEFRRRYQESREIACTLLDLSIFNRKLLFGDRWSFFHRILKNKTVDMYR